jgi:hypothetical protein
MTSIVGPLDRLAFPELCPACGARATQALDIPKWFLRRYDESNDERVYAEVRVPFCARCAEQHERERALQPDVPAYRYPGLFEHVIPAVYIAMGLFFLSIAARVADKGLIFVAVLGAIGLFFLAVAIAATVGAWRVPWYERVPAQTSITSAFDYTDDESDVFQPTRRRYFIRNADFGERFAALNANKQWDPRGPEAARALWKWGLAIVVFILLLIAMILFPE